MALILRSAWAVTRESGHILLEGAPAGFDAHAVAADLEANVPGVARRLGQRPATGPEPRWSRTLPTGWIATRAAPLQIASRWAASAKREAGATTSPGPAT